MNALREFIQLIVEERKSYRLFVYGTLKRGEEAHSKLKSAKFIGSVRTAPKYMIIDLGDGYTGLNNGDESVSGELYELDQDLMDEIDHWEGDGDPYERRQIVLDDGSRAFAYMI